MENGVPHGEWSAQNRRWPLENAPIGPVPGSLGLEDGKDVEKSTRIRLGEVVLL